MTTPATKFETPPKPDERCGCYYCLNVYNATLIEEWTDNGKTAICPKCMIDSVISEKHGDITEENLTRLYKQWFT